MHVVLRCPCGANLKTDIKFVGKEMKCPKCATKLIVPQPPVATVSEPEYLEIASNEIPLATSNNFPPTPTTSRSPAYAQPPGAQPSYAQPSYAQPPYAQQGKRLSPAKKSGFSFISLLITGGVIAFLFVLFGGYLLFAYFSQQRQLSGTGTGISSNGQPLGESEYKKFTGPVSLPPPKANPFDTGVRDLPIIAAADTNVTFDMEQLIDQIEPSIVRINTTAIDGEGVGSGFVLDREGKIMTNFHVIQGALEVTVTNKDRKQTKAIGFIIAQPEKDLAIIQIDPKAWDLTPLPISAEMPKRGESVAAFGAPGGFSFSATQGIVSALREGQEIHDVFLEMSEMDIYGMMGYSTATKWIQTTAAISGGNSGGPLVNMRGQLVGVNTWTHSGGQNLNFASTLDAVQQVFKERKIILQEFQRLPAGAFR